ncbi:hypothetical protein F2P56_031598 [Juglans regia]|uniref:Wax synthase domain-containing protein n=2 Tax=Juglans regia TaxID=51240 RepID=A0A833TAJ6_JUGRE|nr:hypothetical protein F2P56_031598 [Juglans regia]
MEGEINNFIKVWFSVFVSLSYCYAISKVVSKGPTRLLCVLPIVCFFIFLPLNLHSIHLGGTTAFFIGWLANFKLLLFAFGKGPLCSDDSIPLGRFVAVGCFPIQQNIPSKPLREKPTNSNPNKTNPSPALMSHLNGHNKEQPISNKSRAGHRFPVGYAVMGLLLALLIRVYDYSEHIHPKVILLLYCLHIYLFLEVILAMIAALARALLGVELEPQFNRPYLTSSLQDFWGRRWNLMVTNILRITVYDPIRHAATRVIGHKNLTHSLAVFATFVVSGLMHELVFYYLGRLRPTWEITLFFILHGCCLTVEILLKTCFSGRWRMPRLISGPLTIGFVIVTSFWLFFPQFLRFKADERAFREYAALGEFVNNVTSRIRSTSKFPKMNSR